MDPRGGHSGPPRPARGVYPRGGHRVVQGESVVNEAAQDLHDGGDDPGPPGSSRHVRERPILVQDDGRRDPRDGPRPRLGPQAGRVKEAEPGSDDPSSQTRSQGLGEGHGHPLRVRHGEMRRGFRLLPFPARRCPGRLHTRRGSAQPSGARQSASASSLARRRNACKCRYGGCSALYNRGMAEAAAGQQGCYNQLVAIQPKHLQQTFPAGEKVVSSLHRLTRPLRRQPLGCILRHGKQFCQETFGSRA